MLASLAPSCQLGVGLAQAAPLRPVLPLKSVAQRCLAAQAGSESSRSNTSNESEQRVSSGRQTSTSGRAQDGNPSKGRTWYGPSIRGQSTASSQLIVQAKANQPAHEQVHHLLSALVRAIAQPNGRRSSSALLLQCLIRLEEALSQRAAEGSPQPLNLTSRQAHTLMKACVVVPKDLWLITGSSLQMLLLDQLEPLLVRADTGMCKQTARWLAVTCSVGQCEDVLHVLMERMEVLAKQAANANSVLDTLLILSTWCGTELPQDIVADCVQAVSAHVRSDRQYAHLLGAARLAGCAAAVPTECLQAASELALAAKQQQQQQWDDAAAGSSSGSSSSELIGLPVAACLAANLLLHAARLDPAVHDALCQCYLTQQGDVAQQTLLQLQGMQAKAKELAFVASHCDAAADKFSAASAAAMLSSLLVLRVQPRDLQALVRVVSRQADALSAAEHVRLASAACRSPHALPKELAKLCTLLTSSVIADAGFTLQRQLLRSVAVAAAEASEAGRLLAAPIVHVQLQLLECLSSVPADLEAFQEESPADSANLTAQEALTAMLQSWSGSDCMDVLQLLVTHATASARYPMLTSAQASWIRHAQEALHKVASAVSEGRLLSALSLLAPVLRDNHQAASRSLLIIISQAFSEMGQQEALSAEQVGSALSACLVMRWRPAFLLQAAARWAVQHLDQPAEMHISIMRAFAKLGYRSQLVVSYMHSVFTAMALPAMQPGQGSTVAGPGQAPGLVGYRPSIKEVVTLIWTCGRQRYTGRKALQLLVSQLLTHAPGTVGPVGTGLAAWGLARLDVSSSRVGGWASRSLQHFLAEGTDMSAQALANTVWALSRLGFTPEPALQSVILDVLHRQLEEQPQQWQAQELSMLMATLATWGTRPSAGSSVLQAVEQQLVSLVRSDAVDGAGVAGITWALVRMGHTLQQPSLECLHGRMIGMLRTTKADEVLNFAWACKSCHYRPQQLLKLFSGGLRRLLATGKPWLVEGKGAGMELLMASSRLLAIFHMREEGLLRQLDAYAATLSLQQASEKPEWMPVFLESCAIVEFYPRAFMSSGKLVHSLLLALPSLTLQQLASSLYALSAWRSALTFVAGSSLQVLQRALKDQIYKLAREQGVLADVSSTNTPPLVSQQPAQQQGQQHAASPVNVRLVHDLLVGLARMGWKDEGLQELGVRWAMSLPRRAWAGQTSEATTVLWALATLRYDAPELMERIADVLAGVAPPAPISQQARSVLATAGLLDQERPSEVDSQGQEQASGVAGIEAVGAGSANGGFPTDGAVGTTLALPSEPWTLSQAFRLVWSWAKFNRHPGPQLLAAVQRACERALDAEEAMAAASRGSRPAIPGSKRSRLKALSQRVASKAPTNALPGPQQEATLSLGTITAMLWSLAVLREHASPLVQLLSRTLASRLAASPALSASTAPPPAVAAGTAAGEGMQPGQQQVAGLSGRAAHAAADVDVQFTQHAVQVGAALLAAQADRAEGPALLSALPLRARARALAAWRAQVAAKAAAEPNDWQADIAMALKRMGYSPVLNQLSSDGCVCLDIAVQLPNSPIKMAIELVGKHNCAANGPRVLGDAALKMRLLAARGWLVVPLSCRDWRKLTGPISARPEETLITKVVYLQNRIDQRLPRGVLPASLGPAAVVMPGADTNAPRGTIRPPPRTLELRARQVTASGSSMNSMDEVEEVEGGSWSLRSGVRSSARWGEVSIEESSDDEEGPSSNSSRSKPQSESLRPRGRFITPRTGEGRQ